MGMIELKDLTYAYIKDRPILKGLNTTFEAGNMYVLFGPSGCGKTTLLALLGGLDTPTSGEILYNGVNLNHTGLENHRRKNVSFVFQNYNLIDYMTSIENVMLTAKEAPLPVLKKLGLTDEEARRNVLKLSGGQQQRVAIARALASQNPVILADEPTGNLDEDTAKEIVVILKNAAWEYGKCVIVVSHSKEVAEAADTVLELKGGLFTDSEQ